MSVKRIVPCLDFNKGRVVKGVKFVNLRDAGDPIECAIAYDEAGADEMVFLDVTASHERRGIMKDVVKKIADVISIPFTVGGGLHTIDDINSMLTVGADKVSMGTAAVNNPNIIKEASEIFGSQCIVSAIDGKRIYVDPESKPGDRIIVQTEEGPCWFEVWIYGGRKPTGIDAVKFAKKAEELGAGEILLTSMDRDGTQMGYDIPLTRTISENVNLPVVASGGAGTLEHIYEGLTTGKADAALIASIAHFGIYTISEIKEYLRDKGIPVRFKKE